MKQIFLEIIEKHASTEKFKSDCLHACMLSRFSRIPTGVGSHALLQGIFLTKGWNPHLLTSLALAGGFFTTSTTWEAPIVFISIHFKKKAISDLGFVIFHCMWCWWSSLHSLVTFFSLFRWGILFSHPRDFTPVCTTELGRAAKLAPEFAKRNVKMIALSIDSVEDHLAWSKVLPVGRSFEVTDHVINFIE